jgi:hypothetical protein
MIDIKESIELAFCSLANDGLLCGEKLLGVGIELSDDNSGNQGEPFVCIFCFIEISFFIYHLFDV